MPTDAHAPAAQPHRGDSRGCHADCPAHTNEPVLVAFSPAIVPLLGEWLDALELGMEYVPTPPEHEQSYGVVIRPGTAAAALLEPSAATGRLRPSGTPRNRRSRP